MLWWRYVTLCYVFMLWWRYLASVIRTAPVPMTETVHARWLVVYSHHNLEGARMFVGISVIILWLPLSLCRPIGLRPWNHAPEFTKAMHKKKQNWNHQTLSLKYKLSASTSLCSFTLKYCLINVRRLGINVMLTWKSWFCFSFLIMGFSSEYASHPDIKQKFSTRLTRPGVNARVSGPECNAPPCLGSPAFVIAALLCTVSLKRRKHRHLLI